MMACQGPQANLEGSLNGVESDTLLISQRIPGSQQQSVDTIALTNGKFAINLPDSVLSLVYVFEKPSGNKAMRMTSAQSAIVLLPGDRLTINGTLDSMVVTGSDFYRERNDFKALLPLQQQQQALIDNYRTSPVKSDSVRELFRQQMEQLNKQVNQVKIDYIKQHPQSLLAAWLFSTSDPDVVKNTLSDIKQQPQEGAFQPMIKNAISSYESFEARQISQKKIIPGAPAPDFTLPDLKGENRSLSSFRGKFVVLDFWGTWCSWCIKGIPEMKKQYAKYNDKLEIIGIDCRDTEEKWKAGVKEYQLPWVNLYAGFDKQILDTYAVSGFPTKIIIDTKGNIVKAIAGESPEFYKLLDELMSAK